MKAALVLKPCPFCRSTQIGLRFVKAKPVDRYAFICKNCEATTRSFDVAYATDGSLILFDKPDAIDAWNRRPIDPAQTTYKVTLPQGTPYDANVALATKQPDGNVELFVTLEPREARPHQAEVSP